MCDSETKIYDLETKTWLSPPLITMLQLELDKRSKPRHPLWPLCCILNLTRDQHPATPSDHYVASWTWQEIKTPPPPLITMLHLELDKRSRPRHPLWSLCCSLNLTRDQNPATPSDHYVASWTWQEINTPPPPLTTMLHLELDKRSKPRHPLWSLCCILNLTRDQNPATPSDHYVASWTWQEIKTPPPPLITMLHLELDKRSNPRHPLWPLCCLNLTRDQNPATPSDHYVASWTWQEIKTPPPPLTTMLHLELDKRSKPHHPLWSLCCILNLSRDQNPATPSDHYVASWTWQEINTPPPPLTTMLHLELDKRSTPRHPLWSLCCILNLTRDQNPATPSDHYVASWTWQEIKTPPPSLITMLHLELDKRSTPRHPLWSLCCILNLTRDQNPTTPSVHCVASWTWQEINTPPPPPITMLHLELDKRSKPRHPLWSLCCILNLTRDQNPATPSDHCCILNLTRDQNPATPSDHYVASWTWQEIKTRPPPLTTMLHLELDKRSKPRHPLWSLCCILNLTRDQNPATPSDHYVASWTWQEIKTPPPPLITMLHLELDKRSKPRHPLWSLCCILNLTRDQNPATPSDNYVASWTWQEIKTPPPPLTTMLHLELDKRSKPRLPLWSLCCILNLTRDQNPATPSDHHVASWTWQEIKTPPPPLATMLHLELDKRSKPRHPLWSLCCILNLTRDQNPATPSDHYVASWTWQEINTPPPPLTTMLHLELDKRSTPRHPLW